jgi:hypothetical protein
MPRNTTNTAPTLRLPEPRSEFITHASNAATHFGISADAHRVPSPLNGEKVAEGRMRGENAHGFGSRETADEHELTLPPLTPALSPLRGEGTAHRRAWIIYALFAEYRVRPLGSEKIHRIAARLTATITTPRLGVYAVSETI